MICSEYFRHFTVNMRTLLLYLCCSFPSICVRPLGNITHLLKFQLFGQTHRKKRIRRRARSRYFFPPNAASEALRPAPRGGGASRGRAGTAWRLRRARFPKIFRLSIGRPRPPAGRPSPLKPRQSKAILMPMTKIYRKALT